VLVTTEADIAAETSKKDDPLFFKKDAYAPLDVTDIASDAYSTSREHLVYLEEDVIEKLVEETADWEVGTRKTVELNTESQSDLPEEERSIRITRKKTQPKRITYSEKIFPRITGSEKALDETVRLNGGIVGRVRSIENGEIEVVFEPESDEPMDGVFGPVIVNDLGDQYEMEILAQEGSVVRVGPAYGRITEVTDDKFKVDYSNPYAGETLTCDVEIAKLSKNAISIEGKTVDAVLASQADRDMTDAASEAITSTDVLRTAEAGDMATVEYTAYLESGEVIWTTRADIDSDPQRKKIDGYQALERLEPVDVLIGSDGSFLGQGEDLAGMLVGEEKTIVVMPDKAFGTRSAGLMQTYDREKVMPVNTRISAEDYVSNFGGFPVVGKTINFNAYALAKITAMDETSVSLELSPIQEEVAETFGIARVFVEDDELHVRLEPKIGSDFAYDGQSGRIVSVDDLQFTVDFNEPLAGEKVMVDVEVLSLVKAEEFAGEEIKWIEDYEEGLEAVETSGKPAVLFLYADWCGYCKKMKSSTLVDPRVKMMKDDFVWIRVNSDEQNEIGKYYEQSSFPLTVLLSSSGDVVEKISGYRPATEFQAEIKKLL
jgi:FKBP-type peptidyl-prolyl cis-trans isomerase 2